MANIEQQIVSFDLNAGAAIAQVEAYVKELKDLQAQSNLAQKEGRDLSKINAQIAATTNKLNAALQTETKTLQGTTAQTKAAVQANTQLGNSQKQLDKSSKQLDLTNRRTLSNFGSVARGAKSLGGAIAGASAVLGGFGPVAAIATVAADKLLEVVLDLAFGTDKVTDAVNALIPEIAKEKSSLDALFAVAKDETASKAERAAAIDIINEKYGEYLPNLLTETTSVDNLTKAQSLLNKVLIEQAVARFKAAKIQELQERSVAAAFAKAQREKEVAARGAIERTIRTIDGLAGVGTGLSRAVDAYNDLTISQELSTTKEQLEGIDDVAKNAQKELENLFKNLDFSAGQGAIDAEKQINERVKKEQEKGQADRKRAAERAAKAQEKALKGSLADLEAQLSAINKQINEQTRLGDDKALAPLAAQYRELKTQIEQAKTELDQLLNPKQPEKIEFGATFVFDQEGTNQAIQEALTEAERQAGIDRLAIQREQIETLAAIQARKIEQQANKEIEAAKGNSKALQAIEERRVEQRKALDDETTRLLLQNRLKVIELERKALDQTEQDVAGLDTEVAKINLQLEELSAKEVKINTSEAEKDLESLGSKIASIGLQIGELGNQILGFFVEQAGRVSAQYDSAVDKQRSAFEELLSNQETASVQAVQIEAERLEALEAERERAKNREAILIKAQIAANAALAIARAAAEGGGIASAITIASTVASLIFGFAAARQQAEQAFFEGTTFVKLGKGEKPGKDTVRARLNVGEAVIPTATNAKYADAVKAIYYQKIPAEALNAFVNQYPVGMSKMGYSLFSDVNSKGILLAQGTMKQTSQPIVASAGPQTIVHNVTKMDKHGFTTYVRKSIQKEEATKAKHK